MGYQINVAIDGQHLFRTDYIVSHRDMMAVYKRLKKAFPDAELEVTAWSKTGRTLTERELSKE